MTKKMLMAALGGLMAVACSTADVIDEATYAKYLDRAGALMPGLTAQELDLTKAGAWELTGGRRHDTAAGMGIEAQGGAVELVWRGGFERDLDGIPIQVEIGVDPDVPVRVMFHVLNLAEDRFDRMGGWREVQPGAAEPLQYTPALPARGMAKRQFGGFKIIVEGDGLAGRTVRLKNMKLSRSFAEGYFRHAVEIPSGEIWDAVAEVGVCTVLYVNGERVEDETVIMPRPMQPSGGKMYGVRRVPLKQYFKAGRNVLGMYRPLTRNVVPVAYLRGAVVMASGARIPLDTGTNWVWNRTAPDNWHTADYDDAGWLPVKNHADMPRELGLSSYYKGSEAVSSPMSNLGLSYLPRGIIPSYDGVIKLRNPADKKLYFNENKNFQLEVFIPPGFKDQNPELTWAIHRYDGPGAEKNGIFTEVVQGNIKDFQSMHGSLAGEINSARLARGIYVFTSRLMAGDRIIEEREPEMMVVTGKVKMPETAGDVWEQDMQLSLETTVDFTDPFDPHPSFETDHKGPIPGSNIRSWGPDFYHTLHQPVIVERGKLKYRTTRPVNRAQFSYRVEFDRPGDWYLMVLDYPDDDERWIGVSCNASSRMAPPKRGQKTADGSSKCGPAIWTGGKYPNTGKMLQMKWIYRPDPGPHAINVMSLMKDKAAAAARLRVYHIAGRLPELQTGDVPAAEQRRFGMVTERTYPWQNGIYNLFSSFDQEAVNLHGATGAGQFSRNAVIDGCENLRLLEDAASHYAEYMRFAGQNIHAMGCFQYSDANTASQYVTGDPRIHDSSENMLARVLAANDLMFYASVEFVSSDQFSGELNPEWFFADRYGERPMSLWAGKPLNLNFLHPEVERAMLKIARQLAQGFQYQTNFLGINWTTFFAGFMLPSYRTYKYPMNPADDPMENGYDDLTISLFEQDTGIKVPNPEPRTLNPSATGGSAYGGEPRTLNPAPSSIHEQRYQFLTSPEMKPIWAAWRSARMAGFFARMQQAVSAVRPGLEVVAGCYFDGRDHIAEWHAQKISFHDYLDQWGWGPQAFQDQQNVWLMPWLFQAGRYQPAADVMGYAFTWQANKSTDFYRAFDGMNRRAIMLLAGWVEVERVAANYPYQLDWPRPFQQTMMGQQREEMAMEPFTQAMIGMDPQMFMMGFTDVSPYIGVEEIQRKFTRVLRRLPWDKFEPVLDTGLDSNLAIRALRMNDDLLFYVVNPGYWPVKGKITLENSGEVFDLVSGKPLKLNAGVMQVSLEPFGIAAFRASSVSNLKSEISAWYTDPVSEKELAHMRGIIERAKTAVGNPAMAEFLGAGDFGVLTNTIAAAEQALAQNRYVAAWSVLTDAPFWTVLHQKTPEIKYVEFTRRREVVAPRLSADLAPKVDGNLDDRVWSDTFTRAQSPFVAATKAWSEVPSSLRVASVGNRLYIALTFEDPEPEKIRDVTDKDNVNKTIWGSKDDMLALFIRPNESNYYQLAVTVGGAQFDQCNRLKHGVRIVDYEYAPNWKAVTMRTDKGWNVEIEIDVHEAFGVEIGEGAAWRMNFHRQFGLNRHPVASWSYNPGDWHSLEHMGVVRFSTP